MLKILDYWTIATQISESNRNISIFFKDYIFPKIIINHKRIYIYETINWTQFQLL